jgi:hypothetical protein
MASVGQAINGASVRLRPLWVLMKARLATPLTLDVLGGGKVYLAYEDYGSPEGPLTRAWGRQIILPGETLWPGAEVDPGFRGVNWLIRSEMHKPSAGTYDVALALEQLQQIAYDQLQGWAPSPADGLLVRLRIWRARGPQAMPELDEARGMWWLSSEFRCEATRH